MRCCWISSFIRGLQPTFGLNLRGFCRRLQAPRTAFGDVVKYATETASTFALRIHENGQTCSAMTLPRLPEHREKNASVSLKRTVRAATKRHETDCRHGYAHSPHAKRSQGGGCTCATQRDFERYQSVQ